MEIEVIREEKRQADVEPILDGLSLHVKGNDMDGIADDFAALEKELRECRYDRRGVGVILQRIIDMLDEFANFRRWRAVSA